MNGGTLYNSSPDINVIGDGIGAVLTPILSDGVLTSVKVVSGGAGYTDAETSITIGFPGAGAEPSANLQNWRTNLFQKYFDGYTNDDGFIRLGANDNYGSQYSHLYAPRSLRKSIEWG